MSDGETVSNLSDCSCCCSAGFRSNDSSEQEATIAINGNDVQKHKQQNQVSCSRQTLKPPLFAHPQRSVWDFSGHDAAGGEVSAPWRGEGGRQKVDNQDETPLCADER